VLVYYASKIPEYALTAFCSTLQDEYYPIKSIDLKDALSAEPKPDSELTFHIFTKERKYTFKTDSELTRSDWVKALQKAIHHSKIDDEKVKVRRRCLLRQPSPVLLTSLAFTL